MEKFYTYKSEDWFEVTENFWVICNFLKKPDSKAKHVEGAVQSLLSVLNLLLWYIYDCRFFITTPFWKLSYLFVPVQLLLPFAKLKFTPSIVFHMAFIVDALPFWFKRNLNYGLYNSLLPRLIIYAVFLTLCVCIWHHSDCVGLETFHSFLTISVWLSST